MAIEYETKVLDINIKETIEKLERLGAKKVLDCTYKRYVFDLGNKDFIRVRTDGKTTTLTYKKRTGTDIGGVEEIETNVENFETTVQIIEKIPHKNKYYRESKRIMYKLEDIEFCIDTLAKIPTYLEVESNSIEKVKKGLELLDMTNKDVGNIGIIKLYSHYNIKLEE